MKKFTQNIIDIFIVRYTEFSGNILKGNDKEQRISVTKFYRHIDSKIYWV